VTALDSADARLIRDGSSNLYFVTRTATISGRKLTIEKFNALGSRLWTNSVSSGTSGLNVQYSIRDIAISSTAVYVAFQDRDNGGTGPHHASHIRAFSLANGSDVGTVMDASRAIEALAASNDEVSVLARDTTTGIGQIIHYTAALVPKSTVSLGVVDSVADITRDAFGNSYAISAKSDGNGQLSRASHLGGLSLQVALDSDFHNPVLPTRVVVDPSIDRVYVLANGTFAGAPFDSDALGFSIAASTGIEADLDLIGSSTSDEFAADLTLLPGHGFIASAFRPAITRMIVARFGASPNWTYSNDTTLSISPRAHALDADGNLLVLHRSSDTQNRVLRLNLANGTALASYTLSGGPGTAPQDLITDPAGNMYINFNGNGNANLVRFQPALMSISPNNVPGGTPVTGTITLGAASPTNQTWTLQSTSPAVATVPPTATINQGSTSAAFDITVHPVSAYASAGVNARHNGFILQRTFTVIPTVIQAISVSPQVVVGGVPTSGYLLLNGTAPVGGRMVNLSSNKPTVASVPTSTTVPAGSNDESFVITTFGVSSNQGVVITATTGAVSRTAFFAVNAPSLTSISVAPGSIKGGLNATLTLNINGIAPTGGFSIVLFSGAPAIVILSASAGIPAGAVTHNVNVPTTAVTSSTNVLIFATRSGIYKTTTITVTP
jgi:hypothetical protein